MAIENIDKFEVQERILENQEAILAGLSALLTPHCRGSLLDANGETRSNNRLIDCYHKTRKMLGKSYIKRW